MLVDWIGLAANGLTQLMTQEAIHLSFENKISYFVSCSLLLFYVSLALALPLPQELATTKHGGIPRLLENRLE